jgi:osmotically-inducible protein OsmY
MEKARLVTTLTLVTTLMLGGLLVGSVTACSSSRTSESTGEYIDDSVINNKVRAEIVGDKDLSLFQIDVASYKGVVQLSGFVNSQAAKDRAGTIAAGVSGVKQVHNNLIVK